MKILFICTSLEPGRDGVGDYTRRLAGELVRQGHLSAIIAINDKNISEKIDGTQQIDNTDLPVLRLPSKWDLKDKINYAKKYISEFDPEWISLQFVVFGFDPKGLPFGLGKKLKVLVKGRNVHVMFHELWLGMEKEADAKYLLWGMVQRQLIKSMLAKLKPKVITTHTHLYEHHLKKLPYKVIFLPLFSNIARIENTAAPADRANRKTIKLVLFGVIHVGCPVADFAKELAAYGQKNNVSISLTFIGGANAAQLEIWAAEFKNQGIKVTLLGKQSPETVSETLNNSNFGISTTAYALAEKSSSVSVMREHGLKIISVSRPWTPKNVNDLQLPPDIFEYQTGNVETFLSDPSHFEFNHSITKVSHTLIDSFLTI
ncbi:MAG: hypothetical protein JWP44_133 [Mucilaginibacter sp.]|nr:hypothetical protein [Mucilaginibacter sp.]